MDYRILAVRATDEEDGRLYPTVTPAGTVEGDAWDGDPLRIGASALEVSELISGGWKTQQRFKGVKVDVLITDCRFIVTCTRFNMGGGWWGGVAVAAVANGVSKARAAHRRHSKALVGQVRYAWLRCVGYKPKLGWASNEEVRLGVVVKTRDGATRELHLDVRLPKNVDSAAVARAVVARAARYRLHYTDIADAAERVIYEELAEGPALPAAEPKQFALYRLPRCFFVDTGSAYPTVASARAALRVQDPK